MATPNNATLSSGQVIALAAGLTVINALAIWLGDSLPHVGTPSSLIALTVVYAAIVGAANAAWAYFAVTKVK